jgi:hypothetical protein
MIPWIVSNVGMNNLGLISRQLSYLEGLVTSYTGLATVRAFLGLFEGPMFPGIVLYLTQSGILYTKGVVSEVPRLAS